MTILFQTSTPAADPPRFASAIGRTLHALVEHSALTAMFMAAVTAAATWYGGQELIWGNDAIYPLTLGDIGDYFHLPDRGLGAPDARKLPFVLPAAALLWLWHIAGLPYDATVAQPVVVTTLLWCSGCSAYVLVRTLLPSLGKTAAFGAGLFSMFNLYALTTIWSSAAYLSFHYAFLPAVVALWCTALRRRSFLLAAAAAVAWALALTPAYISTPVAGTDTALFAAVTIFELIRSRKTGRRARLVVTAATTYGVWLALNLFWIVPLALNASAEAERGLAAGEPAELFAANSAPLDDAVRLAGYLGITESYLGSPYVPWHDYYRDIGSYAAWAIPVLALIGLLAALVRLRRIPDGVAIVRSSLLPRSERATLAFFGTVLLASIVLMTGAHAPLGDAKVWLVEQFHLTGPFRSVYQRFGVYTAFAYAPLIAAGIAVSLAALQARLGRRRWGGIVVAGGAGLLLAAVAVVPALPMWTGSAFDQSGIHPARRITIPDDYRRAAELLEGQQGDFAVAVLPYGGTLGTITLSWKDGANGYFGVEPLALLSTKPFLTGDASAPYAAEAMQALADGGRRAVRALALLNARFVVLHDDSNIEFLTGQPGWIGLDVDSIDDRLEATRGIRGVFLTDKLRVYEWEGWRPGRFLRLRRDRPDSISVRSVVEPAAVPYRRVAPGRFRVDARGLRAGDVLVLNQPFDDNWRANGDRPVLVRPGVTGFRIDSPGILEVEHRLESRMPLLFALSALTACAVGAAALVRLVRRRRRSVSRAR